MKRLLKDAVRQQQNGLRLNKDQLAALKALQANAADRRRLTRRARAWWRHPLAVAATLAALTVALLLPDALHTPEQDNLVADIAAEVVRNHLNLKPLEIHADRLDSINRYLTRLDFVPVASEYLENKGLKLMGARYCSLRGVTAAQLRLKAVGGDDIYTLYEVGYDPKIFKSLPDYDRGETPVTVYSSGVEVTLWVEKGVLFALTAD